MTPLPVIGVPVPLRHLDGMDSLLSIVQMPAGVPVATVSVGGARNAGLLAVRILAASDDALRSAWRSSSATSASRRGRRGGAARAPAGRSASAHDARAGYVVLLARHRRRARKRRVGDG